MRREIGKVTNLPVRPYMQELHVKCPVCSFNNKIDKSVRALETFDNDDKAADSLLKACEPIYKQLKKNPPEAVVKGFMGLLLPVQVLLDSVLTKKAIILAKSYNLSELENPDFNQEINKVLLLLNSHPSDHQVVKDRAGDIRKELDVKPETEVIFNAFNKFQDIEKNLKSFVAGQVSKYLDDIHPMPDFRSLYSFFKTDNYNGQSLNNWVESVKKEIEKIRQSKKQKSLELSITNHSRVLVQARQEIKTPAASQASLNVGVETSGVIESGPVISLAKKTVSREELVSQLQSSIEKCDVDLKDFFLGYLDGLFPIPVEETFQKDALELFGNEVVESNKPLLAFVLSYIQTRAQHELVDLSALHKKVNRTLGDKYQALMKSDVLNIALELNKIFSGDDAFIDGKFLTDVTSGNLNEIDNAIINGYEEKIQFSHFTYEPFINDLLQSPVLKAHEVYEKELALRLQWKLGLTSDDFHIIRAFRESGGHKGKEVSTQKLDTQLKDKHPEFNFQGINLERRFSNLKEFYPKLLGLTAKG